MKRHPLSRWLHIVPQKIFEGNISPSSQMEVVVHWGKAANSNMPGLTIALELKRFLLLLPVRMGRGGENAPPDHTNQLIHAVVDSDTPESFEMYREMNFSRSFG